MDLDVVLVTVVALLEVELLEIQLGSVPWSRVHCPHAFHAHGIAIWIPWGGDSSGFRRQVTTASLNAEKTFIWGGVLFTSSRFNFTCIFHGVQRPEPDA